MDLFTIGFTQKSAEQFFELIKKHKIELLLDIRLNNKSQLAGFTKGSDLKYFLTQICECKYDHCIDCAPTKEILDAYKKGQISWEDYESLYLPLMGKRKAVSTVLKKTAQYERVCLLCSEPTPEQCHRRLLAELVAASDPSIHVKHI